MTLRAKKPLNLEAAAEADEEIYALHERDDRPNPLYDEQGNRLKLSATKSKHEKLREQWIRLYGKKGGVIQDSSSDSAPPGQFVQKCGTAPQKTSVKACKELLEKLKK